MKLTKPIQPTTTKDRVAEILEDAIFAGELGPGERVVELKIAQQLEIGTTSVREALYDLERRGFVRRIANRGTFVTEFSDEDIEQLYQVRPALEGVAVELLTRKVTSEELASLQVFIDNMEAAAEVGDLKSFYENDLNFHRSIWTLSDNQYILRFLESVLVPIFAFYKMRTKRKKEDLIHGAEAHREIVDAIRKGDPREARKVMERKIRFFHENRLRLRC